MPKRRVAQKGQVIQRGEEDGTLTPIPLHDIAISPLQPPIRIDGQALAKLTDSIRRHGLLQPLLVARDNHGSGYILIAGQRRFRAAKRAGLTTVPAIVRDTDDPVELALVENLQRKDVAPIEQAQALSALKRHRGWTDAELAKILDTSRTSVTEILSLLRLPDEVIDECLSSGNYSKSHLLAVVRCKTPSAQLALWNKIKKGQMSLRDVRKAQPSPPAHKPSRHVFRGGSGEDAFVVTVDFDREAVSLPRVKAALNDALHALDDSPSSGNTKATSSSALSPPTNPSPG